MAETIASETSSPETDRDFDPTADMLVHDYDDEHTLEEEENMSGDSCSNELDDLQKEGDMPLTDLLSMYGYHGNESTEQQDTRSSSEEEILSNQDLTLDKDEIARDLLKNSDDDNDKETDVHDLINSVSHTARLLRSASQPCSGEEDDSEGDDYEPNEDPDYDWKKTIQVGHDYQATVPEGLCKYGDAPAYENEDRLLWDPDKLVDSVVENYLNEIHSQALQAATGVNAIPTGAHIRDDEQALYMLLQCGHNVEEALRRRRMQAIAPTDTMSLWSEEECRNFENGIKVYGKDFYLIQQNKVKTRSVGELVQFYYLWKKTERHDVFANKNRLEKRKYVLHPGITDYMDRFDDQESPAPPVNRERSASPVTCLLYGDPKRNSLKPANESDNSNVNSESKEFDLSSASPTVTTLSPDLKRRSSSPKSEHNTCVNGLKDEVSLEPPVNKKLKKETDVSHYGLEESYSDTSHVDDKNSSLTPGHHISDSITSSTPLTCTDSINNSSFITCTASDSTV